MGLNRSADIAANQTPRIPKEKAGIVSFHRPLRVTHLSSIEARSSYLTNLCDFTDKNEVQITAITLAGPRSGLVEELERHGVRTYALDAMSRWRYAYAAAQIWRLVRREEVDIVHTHLFDPTLIGLVVSQLSHRKIVVTRHHSDALYHLPDEIKRKVYLLAEKYINRYADHIIAPSRMVRDILIENEGVPAAKVSLIPYGQTPDRFDAITSEAIARVKAELDMTNRLVLVCTSRLYERKGHAYLFEALSPLIRAGLKTTLYLVGTGNYRGQLEELSRRFGIQNHVRFLGWREDALTIMAAADIILHPSLEDALSQAVIESLMLGRPVIATDISGVRDILDDGKYGVIVPAANAEAFRVALEEVIARPDIARQRARHGRTHVLSYMDARTVARAYTECYKKIMETA